MITLIRSFAGRAALIAACFALPACGGATREVPSSPAEVVFTAEFTSHGSVGEGPNSPDRNELFITLQTVEGALIVNDSIRVYVNGVQAPLFRPAHAYSTTRTAYTIRSESPDLKILPDSTYAITVAWPDGRRDSAGRFRTPSPIHPVQLIVPERHRDGPLRIAWRGISRPARLEAAPLFASQDSTGAPVANGGGPYSNERVERMIGARTPGGATGQMRIETPLFGESAARRLTFVEVTLVADTAAPASPAFHRDSRFHAERRIEAVVDLASARDTAS